MGVDPDQNAHASTAATAANAIATIGESSMAGASKVRGRKRGNQAQATVHVPPSVVQSGYGYGDNLQRLNDTVPQLQPQPEHEPEGDKPQKKRVRKAKADAPVAEKRLRRFRPTQPTSFDAVYERATTQRFFVLSRTLCGTQECPEMHLEVSGSTGNVYNVTIARQPTCDCPHARAGNQCKHTIFVLKKVLRAKQHYVYQLALLSEELRDIFATCPRTGLADSDEKTNTEEDMQRKPIDGDCPICFEEMASGPGKEALVWCKAACGQNIHRQCFDMWATTKRQTSKITCPYCRSQWETEHDSEAAAGVDLLNIKKTGPVNGDGYINIADQLGISTQRDYSTYSRFWSRHPNAYRYRR